MMNLRERLRATAPDPSKRRNRNSGWKFAALVTAVPSLLWLGLIWRFGVPVLYADEWTLIPFILKLRAGTLNFRDFLAADGPHPMAVTRIFFALFFGSGPLDPRSVMLASWMLATVSAVIGARYLIWPLVADSTALPKRLAGIAFGLWALSLVQFESQLWGFEIGFILTMCCAILGAAVLSVEDLQIWIRLGALALIAGIGTLTSGQALMLWPVFAAGILLSERRWPARTIGAALFIMGFGIAMWLCHLRDAGNLGLVQSFGWIFGRPHLALVSFLALLGSPLAYVAGFGQVELAPRLGVMILAVYLFLVLLAVWSRNLRKSAPFVILGVYGLLYAVLVTLGRASGDYSDWFLTSRYTTSALCLPLAILGLSLVQFGSVGGRARITSRVVLIGAIVLGLANSIAVLPLAKEDSVMRSASMRLLNYRDLFDPDVDGMQTGPFYPLCPINGNRILDWGIAPARNAGLLPPQRAVVTVGGVTGTWRREFVRSFTWYLTHRYRAERLSGSLKPSEIFRPDLVLVRRVGDQRFSSFGLVDGDRWRIILASPMAHKVRDPVEVFAFETASGRLARVAETGL